ncbi:hypothetical protein AGABI1DRAFT_109663 [Agaricus bisporus var. burnettii JB137-S8]|uniref:Fungal-type protein kinase domain-containing protein n=1 Tax=Agaricus bisporus var. burnettii (strain JB137-S8 / ATCC MYA-4627 / FGSC 10392) TaxID=597362 RepID=K5XKL7_AGABU|nr:hypothetical protein AGABI2DRAFT_181719 [Agaricus bisporus var. bisporus H97]XP_007334291.1 uncharacterized protein AGABI1DRAFT_109663 [Agaricus bisporus var. burnettii JB137-S8]EKM75060.1 hypothetical protein AGABI1DRAFT_109663 [Agaricus bisporus var. burnettii JB137-S8]EKV41695.1 hypothetical protein AGABI2DRAFT_181719 [Agaricus bisporus var. bisporus H97]
MESEAYKPLKNIAAVFNDELRQVHGCQPHFFYRDCPYDGMKSEIAGSNFRVDACFSGNPYHFQKNHVVCSETAVVAEFKKSTKDFEDNREKLVSAASHIMNDDPCRMWMYGITIENTKMAVWYFSRSHSVKSETFDFTKDIRTFIRVFLSFTYATREQMGYDPTVHRIKEEKKSKYVYEIPTENGTRYFKTIASLAHPRVLCITGRKTRVWQAVEVKGFEGNAVNEELNGGKQVALKDVWLDDGSTTEKQKLDAIFERLKTIKGDAYEWAPSWLRSRLKASIEDGSYRSYFMEIECDSFNLGKSKKKSDQAEPAPEILQFNDVGGYKRNVTPNDGGIEGAEVADSDAQKAKVLKDQNLLEDSTQTNRYSHISESALAEAAVVPLPLKVNKRLYVVKRQYRLVYSEVGESLKHVKSLNVAFSAILDTYIALVLMYLAGWMHRDISAGNIITVERSSRVFRGKLSDLEYAKHYEDKSGSPDPKTGTPFFMPVEIHGGVAFSRMGSLQLEAPDNIDPLRGPDVAQNVFKKTGPLSKGKSPRYRFQHDLESLWWVALWILIYRVVHPAGQAISGLIFTHTSAPSVARRHMFEGKRVGETLEQNLHPSLSIPDIQTPMEAIQRLLIDSYQAEDVSEPRALHIIYSTFFRFLAILIGAARFAKGVELQSDVVVESNKRPLSEEAAASKDRDSDEYEPDEEEPSSDHVVRKKRKAQT